MTDPAMPIPDRFTELLHMLATANDTTEMLIAQNARLVRQMAEMAAALVHFTDQQNANEPEPPPPVMPARALRQFSQAIGLLSTADAGRVRLGGYAPSLPRG